MAIGAVATRKDGSMLLREKPINLYLFN